MPYLSPREAGMAQRPRFPPLNGLRCPTLGSANRMFLAWCSGEGFHPCLQKAQSLTGLPVMMMPPIVVVPIVMMIVVVVPIVVVPVMVMVMPGEIPGARFTCARRAQAADAKQGGQQ